MKFHSNCEGFRVRVPFGLEFRSWPELRQEKMQGNTREIARRLMSLYKNVLFGGTSFTAVQICWQGLIVTKKALDPGEGSDQQ